MAVYDEGEIIVRTVPRAACVARSLVFMHSTPEPAIFHFDALARAWKSLRFTLIRGMGPIRCVFAPYLLACAEEQFGLVDVGSLRPRGGCLVRGLYKTALDRMRSGVSPLSRVRLCAFPKGISVKSCFGGLHPPVRSTSTRLYGPS